MLIVTRYRVDVDEAQSFLRRSQSALALLASCTGWRSGHVGRAVDDPTLWILTGEWVDVGSYRRALSAPEVKMAVLPLLGWAMDEPTAFEILSDAGGSGSALAADADVVGVGEAAAPVVVTDFDRP
ncbi:MAG TPA: antibiotic biosynthesis monooxygenase [Jiangellaceae bacterium]|jgi:Antibiotic biosynthesis monooxygenase|nr:antibiotic biosynthesis monooxygenase [Jiangellaceae bacterium]